MTTDQRARPWGMSRATGQLPEEALPWVTTKLDPETQTTVFYDAQGTIIDITGGKKDSSSRVYATISMSRPHDGETNAPQRPDDSDNDRETD
ncbi:putative ATP-grasp-modified RiPP [Nonomuraea sp. NPDC050404]|uniref:putative ATP-grasp-modified RiPP n=1 Tax=Nonomuraea sp. NPDC050404 TaxID=3155783 RepID=UPI0033FCE8B7